MDTTFPPRRIWLAGAELCFCLIALPRNWISLFRENWSEGSANDFNPQSSNSGSRLDRKDQSRDQEACGGKGQADVSQEAQEAGKTLTDYTSIKPILPISRQRLGLLN